MSFSEDIIRKTGHRACLREMTGQTYPIYASTSSFSRASFHGTFFGNKLNLAISLKEIPQYCTGHPVLRKKIT